jgi:hypothetical protein
MPSTIRRSWRGCWTKGATKSCLGVDYICSVILSQIATLGLAQEITLHLFARPIADCFILLAIAETESDCFPLSGIPDALALGSPRE